MNGNTISHPSLWEGLGGLPQEFIEYTSSLFGEEKWKNYLASFDGSVPVSVRLNPFKMPKEELFSETEKTPVPWCRNAFYLAERPNFTLDPLLHAGVYYVQEAGSMFLDEVLRQLKENSPPFMGGARGWVLFGLMRRPRWQIHPSSCSFAR